MVWDGFVAFDLFFAGLGAWTFIFALFMVPRGTEARKARLACFSVALVAVVLGAVILAVDAKGGLLNPGRYLGLLGNFGSVMTWGVVLISLFMIGCAACVILLACKRGVPRALEVIVTVVGVGVSAYTGVLLGSAGAFPLWNPVGLPCAFIASAAYTGFAACKLIVRLAGKGISLPAWAGKASVALPAIVAAALVLLLALAASTGGSAAAAAAASVTGLISGSYAVVFWGAAVLVGLVVPLVLSVMRLRAAAAGWVDVAECVCVLVGGLAFRCVIVIAAVATFA